MPFACIGTTWQAPHRPWRYKATKARDHPIMHANPPFKLGLTGSIGMGKTTVANMFAEQGCPVFDADHAVHTMYRPGGPAVQAVREVFPEAIGANGGVDRAALAAQVIGTPEALKTLEGIIHPLVRAARDAMVAAATSDVVVFDIPLLFETDAASEVDAVAVVSAPADQQRTRVLARPGMTEEKYASLLARQLPDAEKRKRATYVIDTARCTVCWYFVRDDATRQGCSVEETQAQVACILSDIRARRIDSST